ncbi:MAG: cytochrome c biogenesis protein ResB [bacterium]|nr:cytochrome c biogenesis protein ResB [bacterium]
MQDDGHQPQTAVEISLSAADGQGAAWLFADQPRKVGVNAVLRTAADPQKLDALLSPQTTDPEADPGSVRIELEGHPYEIPLPECLDHPVPLGDTQTSVHVLEYLPHAVVGADNRLVSASDRPENPAIVVKISGPQGQETHKAFANFPDFHAMHGKSQLEGLKLTFSAPAAAPPDTDLVIISGPDGGLHARFSPQGGVPATHRLEMGQPIDTPWSPNRLAVLRRFEHARMAEVVEPVVPCGKERHQALLVSISRGEHSFETWVQKHIPRQVAFEGGAYKLVYGSKRLPLGFNLTLDKFHLGVYPGSRRPRSFESHVTVLDPATGQTRSRVISMNRPLEHGGYTLYQSSYRKGRGRTSSVLSVAKDPGKPVVFVGYVVTLLGMFIVLGIRLVDQRKAARVAVASS